MIYVNTPHARARRQTSLNLSGEERNHTININEIDSMVSQNHHRKLMVFALILKSYDVQ